MTPSPERPDEDKTKQQETHYPRLRRPDTLAEAPSLGETLLPFLFAAMEVCWINAIFIGLASISLFQSHDTLMPLWGPVVLLIGSLLILTLLERRSSIVSTSDSGDAEEDDSKTTMPGSSLFILFVSVTTVFIIWLSIYAQTAPVYDPQWVFSLLNDILLFNQRAYHLFSIIAISLYFFWRSGRLMNREYEPSQVFGVLRLGLAIIIAVILVRAGQAAAGVTLNDDLTLLLLVPIFLFLSLSAHSLARITFVRHTHRLGLEGDVSTQERVILSTIGIVGVILLFVAWLVDTLASPALLAGTQQTLALLGQGYDVFVRLLATFAVFIVTPLFWLIAWFASLFPSQAVHVKIPQGPAQKVKIKPPQGDSAAFAVLVVILKILIPILLLVAAILILRWALRRRRRVLARSPRRAQELHESLWSWSLFWTQFKALLQALFRRFFPQKTPEEVQAAIEEGQSEPAVRSIREIYRALLNRAATRGYPRKKDETPYEFRQRLDEKIPLAEPQLASVTNAYNATRYGGIVPAEDEVAHIRQEWTTLEQKWQ